MKYSIFTLLLAVTTFITACSQTTDNQKSNETSDAAVIEFETTEHDYGTIIKGGDGEFAFVFTNKGKEPLLLSNVRSSCGCTVPSWPKEPLKKGDEAEIKVKYDTKRIGNFSKSITVYSNATNNPVVLRIKGKVVEEAAAAQ